MLTDAQCQWFVEDALGKLRPELSFIVKKGRQGPLCPPKVPSGMLQKCTWDQLIFFLKTSDCCT